MSSLRGTTWLSEHRVGNKVFARVGRRGEELVAEFPNAGTFIASADGTRTNLVPVAGADPEMLEKLGAGAIDALVRHLQGKLTFHGGAVSLGSAAVVFVGPSGAGKSTLAAALCAAGELDLVADDTVSIELPEDPKAMALAEVLPTQTSAWLHPSARVALGLSPDQHGKVPVALPSAPSAALTLVAVLGLAFDPVAPGPSIRRLRGQEAFSVLSGSIIRFVIDDPEAQVREFDQLRLFSQKCPVFELRRPRELSQLKQSVEVVRQLLIGAAAERTWR